MWPIIGLPSVYFAFFRLLNPTPRELGGPVAPMTDAQGDAPPHRHADEVATFAGDEKTSAGNRYWYLTAFNPGLPGRVRALDFKLLGLKERPPPW
jgi:hypothetical protein